MRFIILVKAAPIGEAGFLPPYRKLQDEMGRYHGALARAGALLDASALQPSATGWRIRFEGETRTLVEGPFTQTKDLVVGYTLIQVSSREEAMEWTRRFPDPGGEYGEIEVRSLVDRNDLQPGPAVARFRETGLPREP